MSSLLGDELDRRRIRALETAEHLAVEVADDDLLMTRLRDDETLNAMFAEVIETASRTALRAKRRLLARAMKQAVIDPAQLDESRMVLDVCKQIDTPHIQALTRLAAAEQRVDPREGCGDDAGKQARRDVLEAAEQREFRPIILVLQQLSLIDRAATWDGVGLYEGLTDSAGAYLTISLMKARDQLNH